MLDSLFHQILRPQSPAILNQDSQIITLIWDTIIISRVGCIFQIFKGRGIDSCKKAKRSNGQKLILTDVVGIGCCRKFDNVNGIFLIQFSIQERQVIELGISFNVYLVVRILSVKSVQRRQRDVFIGEDRGRKRRDACGYWG